MADKTEIVFKLQALNQIEMNRNKNCVEKWKTRYHFSLETIGFSLKLVKQSSNWVNCKQKFWPRDIFPKGLWWNTFWHVNWLVFFPSYHYLVEKSIWNLPRCHWSAIEIVLYLLFDVMQIAFGENSIIIHCCWMRADNILWYRISTAFIGAPQLNLIRS